MIQRVLTSDTASLMDCCPMGNLEHPALALDSYCVDASAGGPFKPSSWA